LVDDDADSYEFRDVIRKFREYRRNTKHRDKPRGSHRAFAATLGGRDKDREEKKDEKKGRPCLCGERHHFRECPYLMESKRPRDWVPDKEI
jgi:hypothetical protein